MRPAAFVSTLLLTFTVMGKPSMAHHSSVMFDRDAAVSVEGTVKEMQWTNPHSWIQLVSMKEGKPVEFSLESQSPNILVRKGWRPDSVKTGDKVKIVYHPLKDGQPGGQVVSITFEDGTTLLTAY